MNESLLMFFGSPYNEFFILLSIQALQCPEMEATLLTPAVLCSHASCGGPAAQAMEAKGWRLHIF